MTITPYYERDGITLYVGDNADILPQLPAESVSALVSDPPAGISFMNKDWDGSQGGRDHWVTWLASVLAECERVMLPGAHALVWALPRTSGWTHRAIEDAGLDVRDCIAHLFGSGFPKSHNLKGEWDGWGTALKPGAEFWYLARKPFSGTVAANVLQHGTGALNIDACRIPGDVPSKPQPDFRSVNGRATRLDAHCRNGQMSRATGRWPANVVLDEDAAQALDAQSGELTSNSGKPFTRNLDKLRNTYGAFAGAPAERGFYGDSGGASRFFYVAKASRKERNAGLEGMPERDTTSVYENGNGLSGRSLVNGEWVNTDNPRKPKANHHPTVKPLALMEWLITLVTPPGGVVLDPFAGSGSTLVACAQLGIPAIGIELSEEYAEIAARRIDHALNERPAIVQPALDMVAD